MRNKNAQNNGKDGEYGEGKNEKEKTQSLVAFAFPISGRLFITFPL